MTRFNFSVQAVPCYWAKFHGKPACNRWLSSYGGDAEPDHVCYETARDSVTEFAHDRFFTMGQVEVSVYETQWPLPVGFNCIGEFHSSFRKWYGKEPDNYPQPLFHEDEAWVSVVACRKVVHALNERASLVWLLGMATPIYPPPEYANLGRSWRFVEPAFLSEMRAENASDCDQVNTVIKKLNRWYRRTVLGKTVGGRPPGTGFFPDKESFLAVFGRAAREVHASGRNPTMRNVLKHVRTSFGDVNKALLSRWVHRFGWATWADFLAEVEEVGFG